MGGTLPLVRNASNMNIPVQRVTLLLPLLSAISGQVTSSLAGFECQHFPPFLFSKLETHMLTLKHDIKLAYGRESSSTIGVLIGDPISRDKFSYCTYCAKTRHVIAFMDIGFMM